MPAIYNFKKITVVPTAAVSYYCQGSIVSYSNARILAYFKYVMEKETVLYDF